MTLLIAPKGVFESCDKCGHSVEFDWTKLGRKYEGKRIDEVALYKSFLNDFEISKEMAKERSKMKFVAKEKPEVKLELGDIVEYVNSKNGTTVRTMIVMGYDSVGKFGYLPLDLEHSRIMKLVKSYDDLESMCSALKCEKDFRIIKSSNLELREVQPMRKFKFQYDGYWEVVEFENDVTEEDIEEEYQQWVLNQIDSYCGWEEIT